MVNSDAVEECVCELIKEAKNEYEFVVNMAENIHKVKEVFSIAKYKVETLLYAPVANTLVDMPIDFTTDYMDALSEANTAVSSLRQITDDVANKYFDIDDDTSVVLSVDTEIIDTIDATDSSPNKRMKLGKASKMCEVVKSSLKVVCDNYEKARQILTREMMKYEKMMEMIMVDSVPTEDEVLFDVRGELMTYSRVSLVNSANTDRTYFDGLLSGNWKTNVIGMLSIKYTQLLIVC
jgi:hypothetical protein